MSAFPCEPCHRGIYSRPCTCKPKSELDELRARVERQERERDEERERVSRERERFRRAQAEVVRFINAQGRHMPPSWKELLVDACELEVDTGNPYHPVHPRK